MCQAGAWPEDLWGTAWVAFYYLSRRALSPDRTRMLARLLVRPLRLHLLLLLLLLRFLQLLWSGQLL